MKDIILVLGSGSARGLSHIGVINVLEERGFNIKEIYGTSIGALIGGLYAAGISAKRLKEILLSFNRKDIIKFFTPTLSISGLIDGTKIKNFLYELIGDTKIEKLKIPFTAIATDIITGEEVVFKTGSLIAAIRASISIPGIFTPVKHNDTYLVDGGLVNPLPVNHAPRRKNIKVVAVNVIPKPSNILKKFELKDREKPDKKNHTKLGEIYENIIFLSNFKNKLNEIKNRFIGVKKGPNMFNIILMTIAIVEYRIVKQSVEIYKPDILIEPDTSKISPFEFFKHKEAVEIGEKAAILSMKKI